MQNEILGRYDVYVSLSKLINELFVADPTSRNSNNFCLHWMVYKLDRNQNAFSSERAKTDSWNYISWHFPQKTKNICREIGQNDKCGISLI